ncbi:hypothetical protein BUY31_06900 [Staphylococcus cohnii]|nr:hypothetical protein BUY31_06900 [Staphylococcus cohnii]
MLCVYMIVWCDYVLYNVFSCLLKCCWFVWGVYDKSQLSFLVTIKAPGLNWLGAFMYLLFK